MLLKDYLKDVNIFNLINEVEVLPFTPPLQLVNLDLRLKAFHGEKTLFESFQNLDPELVANLLSMDFSKKWNNLVIVLAGSDNVNSRREISENVTTEEVRTSTNENINKTSAYDSDLLVVNDGSNTSETGDNTGERVRTLTDEKIDLINSFKVLNVIEQNSILETVLSDIAGYLTLSIYK